MPLDLTPEKGFVFRITHRNNLPFILQNGLHSRRSGVFDPKFVSIGNTELIEKRNEQPVPVPPGGFLSDYIPFYFTPKSMMAYNIKTGYGGIKQRSGSEIVILVSSLEHVRKIGQKHLYTDRHASTAGASFFSGQDGLDRIDWKILRDVNFSRDVEDMGKGSRYQAEALMFQALPLSGLLGVACYDDGQLEWVAAQIKGCGANLAAKKIREWFF